jgi:hypothetical protein
VEASPQTSGVILAFPSRTARAVRVSAHACVRWCERVDPAASDREAWLALHDLVARGRHRPTPRHWTVARPQPGLVFVYLAERPDVCALVCDGAVVTVLTRTLCRMTDSEEERVLRWPTRVRGTSARARHDRDAAA